MNDPTVMQLFDDYSARCIHAILRGQATDDNQMIALARREILEGGYADVLAVVDRTLRCLFINKMMS